MNSIFNIATSNLNLTFSGKKKSPLKRILPFVAAPLLVCCSPKLMPLSEDKIEWNKNTKVLAACPQNESTYSYFNPGDTLREAPASFYFKALKDIDSKKNSKGIEHAHQTLSESGYFASDGVKDFNIMPVQTPRVLDIFKKDGDGKNRFVLILGGLDDEPGSILEQAVSYDSKEFKKFMSEQYNVPDANFHEFSLQYLRDSSEHKEFFATHDVEDYGVLSGELKKFTDKVDSLSPDLKNAEIMIFYDGHGYRKRFRRNKYQGGDAFRSSVGPEKYLKELFNSNPVLKKVKGNIIMLNACHAGAAIADAKNFGVQALKSIG